MANLISQVRDNRQLNIIREFAERALANKFNSGLLVDVLDAILVIATDFDGEGPVPSTLAATADKHAVSPSPSASRRGEPSPETNLPKINSEGLKRAAEEGHKRVSSVSKVSRSVTGGAALGGERATGDYRTPPWELLKHRLSDIVFFVTKTLAAENATDKEYCEALKRHVLRSVKEAQEAYSEIRSPVDIPERSLSPSIPTGEAEKLANCLKDEIEFRKSRGHWHARPQLTVAECEILLTALRSTKPVDEEVVEALEKIEHLAGRSGPPNAIEACNAIESVARQALSRVRKG